MRETQHRRCAGAVIVLAMLLAAAAPAAAQGQATTVQLPTFGVAVDAEGVLGIRTFEDPTGRLRLERLAAARARLSGDLVRSSPVRKVSLVRLEAAVRQCLDEGRPPEEAMLHLAGLQRLQYVFFYPERNDIVIAGPAEGWAPDPSGRVCGMTTGLPVLELADLVVALRAFPPGGRGTPFVGCTIDPTPEAMRSLQAFQRTVPRVIPQAQRQAAAAWIAHGMAKSLGFAPVRVFGVPADTHFAQVMIEADYRMKLIGLGLERPPVRLASYLDLLGAAPPSALERWWFTPNYDCVKVSGDHLGMELVGQGVQLQAESQLVGADGQFKSGAPSNRPSETFALGFTRKYPELAAASPVYAQLRNAIDLLVAAAFIQQQGYARRAGWDMATFGDEGALGVRTQPAPQRAAAAVNAAWKGNRLLALAGGGVSIRPAEALQSDRLIPDADGKLAALRSDLNRQVPDGPWWWD